MSGANENRLTADLGSPSPLFCYSHEKLLKRRNARCYGLYSGQSRAQQQMHLRAPKPHRRLHRHPLIGTSCWQGAPSPRYTMQLAQAHTALRPAAAQQRNLAVASAPQRAAGALRSSQVIDIAPSKWGCGGAVPVAKAAH